MKVLSDRDEIRRWARNRDPRNLRVVVPTMGALHEGHLSLVDLARQHAGDSGEVVATIFVNPTQFAPHEDFDAYPRQLEDDLALLKERTCDVVVAPEREAMYLPDASVSVVESAISTSLEGASRPQFFTGVCTIVTKLFHLVQPDAAVFGEKDFQQLAVIRRLIRDLDFPLEILAGPTVREPDGLAMSSRNAYLSPEERRQAIAISQALEAARHALDHGEVSVATVIESVTAHIGTTPLARIDYVAGVHPDTLEPLETVGDAGLLVAVAAFFGKTRLIDNLCWRRNLGDPS